MYIEEIELHLAKRLVVRGIKHFKATFTSLYQIILGTNGSGKSYLVSELSPLPASPKMFEKGGYKRILIRDNDNNTFECINRFDKGSGVHSFIMNGVDLNENGTGTIQSELVAKYFKGLTPELFKVLTFRKFSRFTEMDANKRRNWMMTLSGIDLDWAMDVYQALRVRARDASGHVKRINQKLAVEAQVVVDDEEVVRMEEQLHKMQADFTEALRLTKTGIPSLSDIERLLTPKLNQLKQLDNDLNRYMSKVEHGMCTFGLTNKEGVDRFITSLETNIETTEANLSKAYQDKMQVDGELNKLKELGAEGLNEYKEIINKLEIEINLSNEAINDLGFGDETRVDLILGMCANADSLVKALTPVLTNLFDNSTGVINLEKTDKSRSREHFLILKIRDLQNKIEQLTHRMNHSKETSDVECPSCSFVFKPGFYGNFDVEAPIALARMEEELKTLQNELKEIHEYLSNVQDQVSGLKVFDQVATMFGGYHALWTAIGDFGIETNNPKLAINILNKYIDWIHLLKHRLDIKKTLDEKTTVYEQAKQMDSKDMESTQKQASDLEVLIEENISNLEVLRKKKQSLTELSKTLAEIDEGVRVSELLVEEINLILEQEEEASANLLLEDVLKTLQSEMETLERHVSRVRVQRAIVEDLKITVEQAKFEQDMYKFLADELSPTDGLIADILKRFIESFTTNQTNIIASIWSYPLTILPCISNKEGLDYKFPFRVFGSNLVIPDVSEGSDAQVDVIDFSFVGMVMNLLDLHDFPLYLDEPISRMDEIHRIEMIRIIQSMVESNQCSQMFFISHFAAQHGSFAESETIVMDSSNIVNLPTIFNKHCVIN